MEKSIIDIGSNSIKMNIYNENGEKIFRKRYTVCLSQGMNEDLLLQPEAMERTVKGLLMLLGEAKGDVIALATAAVRKAKNKTEFLEKVKRETGLKVRVIDGDREAFYDFYGVKATLGIRDGLIVDIGGGSTELIGVKGGFVVGTDSIPYGARTMAELYFGDGETEEKKTEAYEKIFDLVDKIEWINKVRFTSIIGLGGTAHALGIQGSEEMTSEEFEKICKKIEDADIADREKMDGIGDKRADIIMGGILILKAIRNRITSGKFIVSDKGICDGVFYAERDFENI